MRRIMFASVMAATAVGLLVWGADQAPGGQVPTKTHQVALNGHNFTLPIGFDIELAAGPPLVDRPIVADFDEQGRLYVADSSGSNDKVEVQLKNKPHRIVRLEDSTGAGRFDRRTVFAEKMMFPEGAMWLDGSLYVSAPPSIWKLTDTKGDGVADQRVEWFKGKTLTGCANDLHGPYLGPDGWIYWCKGAFAQQTHERPGRSAFITKAAHIFRCRPDGTGIEPVMTGGMDNPVEVVFTPGGERVFTTTFLQHPGGGRRDGLIHAIYGGVYGKDHAPIYDHPWTGPDLMPVLVHLGPAAPSGLTRYESTAFGAEYQDNLFACLFNMQQIKRVVLTPHGATFSARDEDFLVSDNRDFHPTDVLEDADGSLLVIDTGGWYKLCCPTSQLHKPDILGAIYRIRRTGAKRVADPRGLKLPWSNMSSVDLAKLLDDSRPTVRRRARQSFKGPGAAAALEEVLHGGRGSMEARRNAVWAATQLKEAAGRDIVRAALGDSDESVRQAAIHSVSLWRDAKSMPELIGILRGPSAHNQRAAAEALGRIGDKSAVPTLLEVAGAPADRVLEHSLTYALIEIADPEGTRAGLASSNPRIHRTALIALDQMGGGALPVETVTKELSAADPTIKEIAWWIAGRHPKWGAQVAGFLGERLAAKGLTEVDRKELVRVLSRFAQSKPVQDLLAERLGIAATRDERLLVLRAMAQAGLKEAPERWITGLTQALSAHDAELLGEMVATARALRVPRERAANLSAVLLKVGVDDKIAPEARLGALAAVPGGLVRVEPGVFTFLCSHLGVDQSVVTRSAAAEVIAKAKLDAGQLMSLTEVAKTVGPTEIDRILEAFGQTTDDAIGHGLLKALGNSAARSTLRVGILKPLLEKYSSGIRQEAEKLYALLNVDAANQSARLEHLLGKMKDGDIRRGQAVFNSPKAACFACHAIGYMGGNVGPDLTHIARIRTDRDLLESIVFPSASLVRSYEPVVISTKNGKFINGLIRSETAEEIVLAIGVNQEARVARADIEEMQPSKVSIMPAGLDQQLTPAELADLVAFLRACK